MFKKTLVIFLFVSAISFAQQTIKGTMKPIKEYPWMMAYKLNGSKQDFITYDSIKKGEFELKLPVSSKSGMYRLFYDVRNRLYVDVFYDNEDIEFSFNPISPLQPVKFLKSKNNILYNEYIASISKTERKLDSLQLAYFNSKSAKTEKLYKKELQTLFDTQQKFEELTINLFVHDFIKSNKKYYSKTLHKSTNAYLKAVNEHYYDNFDFGNKKLSNSTFLHDKINEYIFRINNSNDQKMLRSLRKKAINTTLDKIKNNVSLSQDIQEGLLYSFAQIQDVDMTNFMLNHYLKLPKSNQDVSFINDIKGQLRTAVGNIAPNILWQENGKQKTLHLLSGSPKYLVIFWSSSCGHCLQELPKLATLLKTRNDVEVIAVGLETEESKTDWQAEIAKYKEWTHVYGKGKWKNRYAKAYSVNATPTFLLLDSRKKIIVKPDSVKELNNYFKQQ